MTEIQRYFHARQQQKCELVICIMDSFWMELRPAIKLNGTVTYGEKIVFISLKRLIVTVSHSVFFRYHYAVPDVFQTSGTNGQVSTQPTR